MWEQGTCLTYVCVLVDVVCGGVGGEWVGSWTTRVWREEGGVMSV